MLCNNSFVRFTNGYRLGAKLLLKREKRMRFNPEADDFSTAIDDKRGRTDTVDLSYSVYEEHCSHGTSGAVPIVVAHGLFGSKNNWHSLAKALNRMTTRKVVTVDFRCHGDSPHHPYVDCDIMSNDLVQLVTKELRLSKVALLGHSMGGSVALRTALKMPDLIECVVAVDISLVTSIRSDTTLSYLDKMLSISWDPTLSLSVVRKLVDSQLADTVKMTSVRQWLLMNLVNDGKGNVRWRLDLRSLRDNYEQLFALSNTRAIYSGPTLYVAGGASDYIARHQHDAIREQFPSARFEYISDAGHWVHTEKPNEFLDIVTKFINRLNK